MVIIELDWKKYEAVELVERTQEDIEAEIALKQSYIDNITLTDIETLEMLVSYGIIEQDVLDLWIQANETKESEIAWLKYDIEMLEDLLNHI